MNSDDPNACSRCGRSVCRGCYGVELVARPKGYIPKFRNLRAFVPDAIKPTEKRRFSGSFPGYA
jgi:hypothetical protein